MFARCGILCTGDARVNAVILAGFGRRNIPVSRWMVTVALRIEAPKGGLSKYSWNQRVRYYHRCGRCGCVTHYTYRKKRAWNTVAVNAVNFDPAAIVGARVRRLDGASTWKYLE